METSPRRLFYLIDITNACSLTCPVCYRASSLENVRHEAVDHVLALGRRVRADGGRFVQLMGGEPSEHPNVLDIVRGLRRLGLRPVLVTNGVRLGTDAGFAGALRRAGLHKVSLQFDTLDAQTSIAMRGRDLIEIKQAAVRHTTIEGLRLGVIATICDRNLSEVVPILHYSLGLTPSLNTVTFQCFLPVGRAPSSIRPVSRDDILREILHSAKRFGVHLSPADILPAPYYRPWRALTHPACASLLYLCRDVGLDTAWPLGRDVDLPAFYARLRSLPATNDSFVNTVLRPLGALWASARHGSRWATLRRFASLVSGRGAWHLCVVHVDGNAHGGADADERRRRCPACYVTDEGFVSICAQVCAVSSPDATSNGGPA